MNSAKEKQIRAAVEVIVADVLFFAGTPPLRVATGTERITPQIVEESNGYKRLLELLATREAESPGQKGRQP